MNNALNAMFTSFCSNFPPVVHLQVEATGDTIDSSTGALVGSWADTVHAGLIGTSGSDYSAVSGALLRWFTNTFLSGRRLRGHTFLVPISGGNYDSAGQIIPAVIVGYDAIVAAFIAAMGTDFKMWQRPRLAKPAYTDRRGVTHPAISARGGGFGPVITGSARPTVTELRSRRD